MNSRRGRVEIIFDILRVVQQGGARIKPTHLLYKSNLSHSRMKKYVEELKKKGMLSETNTSGKVHFHITEQGSKFLADYFKVRELTEAFGL